MKRILPHILLIVSVFVILAFAAVPAAFAGPIIWTDWTTATIGHPGSASGTMGAVNVTYSGEVFWAQTDAGTGTNWWTEGARPPYTGSRVIDNAPPASDIIALNIGSVQNTITFSSPILDPVMAFVSIGRDVLPVDYEFDQPFDMLCEGDGYFGNGWWSQSGNTLTGYEAHGAIQFIGLVSSISWINTPSEDWHGFTIGAPAVVPEPGSLALLVSGLIGLAAFGRKIK